ncbi:hypothetical protein NKG05_18455 [Oerskovia sp. M15]
MPVRVASKSVRVRSLVERAGALGFAGIMAYSLAEALWLVESGARDVLVAYPTVDRRALAELAADPAARREITLMVDDVAQVALVASALQVHRGGGDGGDSLGRRRPSCSASTSTPRCAWGSVGSRSTSGPGARPSTRRTRQGPSRRSSPASRACGSAG